MRKSYILRRSFLSIEEAAGIEGGHRFTRGHAKTCQRLCNSHLKDFFGDKKLNCVTTSDLENVSKQLASKELSTSSMSSIMHVACKPLRWAFEKKEKILAQRHRTIEPSNRRFAVRGSRGHRVVVCYLISSAPLCRCVNII